MAKTQTKSKKQATDAKNLVPELRKSVLAAYRIKHCLNPDLQDLQINMIFRINPSAIGDSIMRTSKQRSNPENPLIREIGVQTIG